MDSPKTIPKSAPHLQSWSTKDQRVYLEQLYSSLESDHTLKCCGFENNLLKPLWLYFPKAFYFPQHTCIKDKIVLENPYIDKKEKVNIIWTIQDNVSRMDSIGKSES